MTTPPNSEALGKAIAQLRRSKGLKQKQVVEQVRSFYSDERAYRRVESGERLPDRDAVIAILGSLLSSDEIAAFDRILGLGGYAPLTATEARQLRLSPQTTSAPRADRTSETGFWNRLNRPINFRPLAAIAAGSLLLAGVIAVATQETAIVMVTAVLYASLNGVSILLESIFESTPGPKWPVTTAVFSFVLTTSVIALSLDAWLANRGVPAALPLSLSVFVVAATVQWTIARSALSQTADVPLRFRGHTGQTAHLKNTASFLVIVVLFWLPTFHCVAALRREIQSGNTAGVKAMLANRLLLGRGLVCFNAEPLWYATLLLFLLSIAMAARLLENLHTDDPRLNTYTILFYVRGIVYFLLILVCLIWYSSAIGSLFS